MIDTLYQADIFVRIFCQEYSRAYFLLGDFGSVSGRQSRAGFLSAVWASACRSANTADKKWSQTTLYFLPPKRTMKHRGK